MFACNFSLSVASAIGNAGDAGLDWGARTVSSAVERSAVGRAAPPGNGKCARFDANGCGLGNAGVGARFAVEDVAETVVVVDVVVDVVGLLSAANRPPRRGINTSDNTASTPATA